MPSVDNKIVNMQFNNGQFESGVKTTIKTLDEFKSSLNLEDAAKKMDLSSIAAGVDSIAQRFTLMGVIGQEVFHKIADAILLASKQAANFFVLAPMSEGMSEYELKMNTIQAVMNATGHTADEVSAKLVSLDDYADKTIYSTKDMFDNLSTFTNMGVSLDDASTAMIGIANATALAGQGTFAATIAYRNFSDGISAGYLNLMDFRSLSKVAKIATQEFRGELIKAAVATGTLVEGYDGLTRVATTGAIVNKNFELTLKDQWLTSDALIYAMKQYGDETTDVGARAWEAAQSVKTFTQLMETTSAALTTGWSQTWEIVIGGLEEAKTLWTGVSNVLGEFIGRMNDSRNAFLGAWKEMGGRGAVIKGLSNLFEALTGVLKPLSEAFTGIFGTFYGRDLYKMSIAFRDFTATLIPSEETVEKFRKTFSGVFAVFSIVGKVVSIVWGLLREGLGLFSGLGGSLLGFTAGIGDFVVGIDKAFDATKVLNTILNGIKSAYANISAFLAPYISFIGQKLQDFANMVVGIFSGLGTFDDFTTKVKDGLSGVGTLGDRVRIIFDKLKEALAPVAGFFTKIGEAIKGAFEKAKQMLKDSGFGFNMDTFKAFTKGISAGAIGAILAGLISAFTGFIKSLKTTTTSLKQIVTAFKGILTSLSGTLNAFSTELKSEALINVAKAVAIFAAALLALSFVPPERLLAALAAISVITVELLEVVKRFDEIGKQTNFKTIGVVVLGLVGLAVAVGILAAAASKLKDMRWQEILAGVVGVGGLIAAIVVANKYLKRDSKELIGTAAGLAVFALAIRLLAAPVKELGAMEPKELLAGVAAVVIIMAALAGVMDMLSKESGKVIGKGEKLVGKRESFISLGAGLILFSLAIKLMLAPIKELGEMNREKLVQGMVSVLALMGAMALLAQYAGKEVSGLIKAGIGMLLFGKTIAMLIEHVAVLGEFDPYKLGQGLIALGALIGEIGLFLKFSGINKLSAGAGLSLAALALAVLAMVNAVTVFADMNPLQLLIGIAAIGAALLILAIAVDGLTASIPGAIALTIVAAALLILIPVLFAMSKMDLGTLISTMLKLAGALLLLGGVGSILALLAPILMVFVGVLIAVGAGVALLGAGLFLFSAAMTAAAVTGVAGAVALVAAFGALLTGLIALTGTIFVATVGVITAIVAAIVTCIPLVVDGVLTLIVKLLEAILKFAPKIIDTVVLIIEKIILALAKALPVLINSGIQLMLGFINGLAKGIRENTDKVLKAVKNLISAIIEFAIAALAELVGLIPIVGGKMKDGLLNMKETVRDTLAPEEMEEIGEEAMVAVADGAASASGSLGASGSRAGEEVKGGFLSGLGDMFGAGKDGAEQGAGGLLSGLGGLGEAGGLLGGSGTDGFAAGLGGMFGAGQNGSVDGVAGFLAGSTGMNDAGASLAESGITGMKDGFEPIYSEGEAAAVAGSLGMESLNSRYHADGQWNGEEYVRGLRDNRTGAFYTGEELAQAGKDGTLIVAPEYTSSAGVSADAYASELGNGTVGVEYSAEDLATAGLIKVQAVEPEYGTSGENAAAGYAAGIEKNTSLAEIAAAAMASRSAEQTRRTLAERSPSRVFREIGEYVSEGFAIGIEDKANLVSDASTAVSQNLIDSMRSAMQQVSQAVTDGVDPNPVIRPVLDLEDVTSGVGKLNGLFSKSPAIQLASSAANAFNQNRYAPTDTLTSPQNGSENSTTFVQNNYSPKALSRIEIYRQTKRLVGSRV